jgi:hypothetical protein
MEFAECIRSGKRPTGDFQAGWWSTLVALAGEKAVREQRVIELRELSPKAG